MSKKITIAHYMMSKYFSFGSQYKSTVIPHLVRSFRAAANVRLSTVLPAYTDGGWNKASEYESQPKIVHRSSSVAILGHKHHPSVHIPLRSTPSRKRVVDRAEAQSADEKLYIAVGVGHRQQFEHAIFDRCRRSMTLSFSGFMSSASATCLPCTLVSFLGSTGIIK